MATFNLKYSKGEDGYSDGEIESILYEKIRAGESSGDILRADDQWPTLYHISHFRQNILNWYPFKPDASLLEIGAGPGALTELFCDRVASVTSVELTQSRARVNYARNEEKKNLEIVVGNFNDIAFNQKFDYIILNGVLEYAGSFTETDNPYHDFLVKIRSLLKPDGIVLIAIENRMGVKYLNGAPEDHSSRLFTGINGYNNITSFRTFCKDELSELVREAGFHHQRFFYPFPDYKFPIEIYTDKSLDMDITGVLDCSFNANRLQLYNEKSFYDMLQSEGVLDHFFNSFLLEISPAELPQDSGEISYVKLPLTRRREFCIETLIEEKNGEQIVSKRPVFPEAAAHLDKMVDFYDRYPTYLGYRIAPVRKEGEVLYFDFVKGETLEQKILDALHAGDIGKAEEIIAEFAARLRTGAELYTDFDFPEFEEMFGHVPKGQSFLCQKVSNVDMIFSNVIVSDQGQALIDYEWVYDFPVPVDFIIWRALYMLFHTNEDVRTRITFGRLLHVAGVHIVEDGLFEDWNHHFNDDFISNHVMIRYYGQIVGVAPLLDQQYDMYNLNAALEIHYADGSVDTVEAKPKVSFDHYRVRFDLSDKRRDGRRIHRLRWCPGKAPMELKGLHAENDNDIEFRPQNGIAEEDDRILFATWDPWCEIYGDFGDLEELSIACGYEARIDILLPLLLRKSEAALQLDGYQKQCDDQQREIERLRRELAQAQRERDEVLSSRSWKLTSALRDGANSIRKLRDK